MKIMISLYLLLFLTAGAFAMETAFDPRIIQAAVCKKLKSNKTCDCSQCQLKMQEKSQKRRSSKELIKEGIKQAALQAKVAPVVQMPVADSKPAAHFCTESYEEKRVLTNPSRVKNYWLTQEEMLELGLL